MRHSLAVFLLLTLTACSMLDPLPTGNASDSSKHLSAEELYHQAKTELDDNNFSQAIKLYEALQSRYPYGQYAQQSMLEMAYAYYRDSEPDPAISTADRFIKQFPNNPRVDYAYYVKGLATFNGELSILSSVAGQDKSERDPQSAQESFKAFKELITRFPDSKYSPDARVRMQYLVNSLARHELHVAGYYLRRGAYIAALNRAQGILKDYPNSPATLEALEIMANAYDGMGMTDLRDDTRRVLAVNAARGGNVASGKPEHSWWQFWK
ncbi:MAG: outer membrane protein assembly factor BamD [Gallionella sp.]|nr:outer membrane protein assembly factor BamD [Gallionella sp.]